MSSTNRSNKRDNHVLDYYVTPIEKIKEFIDEIVQYENDIFEGSILDPCAGGDSSHPMSYPTALQQCGYNNIYTIDIRDDSLADIKGNYLTMKLDFKPDTIITNPPFMIAREIIEKALNDVAENGFVIMLLRLNFFGGKLRKDLWDKHMPKYCFVHHRRMSFTDDGKTDSIEYAHFVWQKGYNPEFTYIKVI
jgi:hypothetical protein